MDLAEALESFNRKERNLLIRAVLGHKDEPLPLSDSFCADVRDKLKIELPRDAWWATDYHISWLAGALSLYYAEGIDQVGKPQQNLPALQDKDDERHLVESNQEDIDLVIATGEHLIMIEAKAYGAWSNRQMASKLKRLELLHQYDPSLPHSKHGPVHFHLLLMSPNPPEKLDVRDWPSWACREEQIPLIPLHIPLHLNHWGFRPEHGLLEVTRCDQAGNRSARGDRWMLAISHDTV